MDEKNVPECATSREKYWKELSIEEKIERTREQVKATQFAIDDMRETIMRVEANFSNHNHLDGKILVGLNVGNAYFSSGKPVRRLSKNPDEVYF